ncbi:MAG: VWA domain-containing protein [bacterium]|nr:VWA domain-containing protein [bacterium]
MDTKLVEFAGLLRRNGIRVSLSETMEAFRALSLVGLDDRATVRAALRAAVVKRGVDVPSFDRLFDLYFTGMGETIRDVTQATQAAMDLDPEQFQDFLEQLEQLLEEKGIDVSELARALLRADSGALERLLREAAEQGNLGQIEHGFQEGRFTHAIAGALGLGEVGAELDRLRQQLEGVSPDMAQRLERYFDRRLRDLQDLLRSMVRQELDRHDVNRQDRQGLQTLAEKSFFYLTEDEIRRMQEAVTKLAHRLRNVVAIRRKRARRGRFDSSETMRRNLQYGGVPFRVVFDKKRKERPQVMVLCDVSDSVRNVSRFMLQFVYALQDLYSKVRSFIFVADLGEVTQIFQDREIGQALDAALQGNLINIYAHSDFGRAFRSFHRDYLGAVSKRTTVIVLGDARNNYNLPHEWVLRDVQQRAKQVIWLNPENRMTWGFGDSEMDRYAPYCTIVEECRNLNQLYRVIDRMVMG